jgi:hypothetical protein
MAKETFLTSQFEEPTLSFRRTPSEVEMRLDELRRQIRGHDVWIHTGSGRVPEPNSRQKRDILEGKLLELRWALGEDIDVTEGIYW